MKEKKSGSLTSSRESADSAGVSEERTRKGGFSDDRICTDIAPTLLSASNTGGKHQAGISHKNPLVVLDASGHAITTSTPTKSTPNTSEKPTTIQATLRESIQGTSPTLTSFVLDFLANPLAWRGKGRDSRIPVARYSMRFPELRKLKDLRHYSSKTLKDFFQTTEDKPSRPFFRNWGVSDTGQSGRYLTANITESLRTGKECSLSDILETDVPDRYFLSPNQVKSLMSGIQKSKLHPPSKTQDTHPETIEE